jgi:hypothetical protein
MKQEREEPKRKKSDGTPRQGAGKSKNEPHARSGDTALPTSTRLSADEKEEEETPQRKRA